MEDKKNETKNIDEKAQQQEQTQSQEQSLDEIIYPEEYFGENEKFKIGDDIVSFKEVKEIVKTLKNKAKENTGNNTASKTPQGSEAQKKAEEKGAEKTNANATTNTTENANANVNLDEKELQHARMLLDAKISNTLSLFKYTKGIEIKKDEVEKELKALADKGEQITLDTVDVVVENIYKAKEEQKKKELSEYIEQKKKEKTPLGKSQISKVANVSETRNDLKIDYNSIIKDFSNFKEKIKGGN